VGRQAGRLIMDLLDREVRPSHLLTATAFDNAIASVAGTGGSTNAVLHLLALAHECGLELDMVHFDRVSRRTPILADLKPGDATSRSMSTPPAVTGSWLAICRPG
jgi:dihydroxy-acid dehydratase